MAREARGRRVTGVLAALALAALAAAALAMLNPFERLAYLPERGAPPPPPGVEEMRFASEDGTPLHGWFFPGEPDAQGATRGAILAAHGNAGNVANHAGFVTFLPPAGFDVLLFDYRGYGNSGPGRLHRRALFADTQAAYRALRARPGVDPARIAIYGQSLGSCFAAHAMAAEEGIRAGVLVSAFASWPRMAASVFGGRQPGPLARLAGRVVLRRGLDTEDAVRSIAVRPLLLVHGTADRIVPFDHAERLAAVAGPNARLVAVEGGDHNSLPFASPEALREIVAFYGEALATGPGPAPGGPGGRP